MFRKECVTCCLASLAVVAMILLAVFEFRLSSRVSRFEAITKTTGSMISITREGQSPLVFVQAPGQSFENFLSEVKRLSEMGGETLVPKKTEWTTPSGSLIEVQTNPNTGDTMQTLCDRHDLEVRQTQFVFPCD